MIGFDGDADSLGPGVFGGGIGAAKRETKKQQKFVLTRTVKTKKRKPF
jgi:hypothetical protein